MGQLIEELQDISRGRRKGSDLRKRVNLLLNFFEILKNDIGFKFFVKRETLITTNTLETRIRD